MVFEKKYFLKGSMWVILIPLDVWVLEYIIDMYLGA